MECYFDNAATTAVFPEVKELMITLLDVDYGNPSSQHKKGLTAKDYERTATEQVAKTLKCMPKEIVFTSGGTEANNLALIGAALAHRRAGKHIITTPIEHASVLSTVEFLQKEGFEISFMEVGSDGKVDLDSLSKLLRDDTILVSCMYVNNEIGSIQPIEALVKLVKAHNPQTLVHAEYGSGFIAFSPLAQGLLTDKYLNGIPEGSRAARPSTFLQRSQVTPEKVEAARQLNEIARHRGQTLAEMALAWVLRDERMTSVIVGASSVNQLADNLQALNQLEFTAEELNGIERILCKV